jgi:AcrR family transcriptional regulator
MGREKVQDKYRAILDAAVAVFAERGFWDTPTSLISKTAGVADGTLFNYFKTKDDLINEVYVYSKRELAKELLAGIDVHRSVRDKMQHLWNRYIVWGVEHPDKFKVLQQIGMFYEVTDAVKAQANEPFADFQQMISEYQANGMFKDYPIDYLAALVDSQAVMTVRLASMNRDNLVEYQRIGFDILWNGVTG